MAYKLGNGHLKLLYLIHIQWKVQDSEHVLELQRKIWIKRGEEARVNIGYADPTGGRRTRLR